MIMIMIMIMAIIIMIIFMLFPEASATGDDANDELCEYSGR